jgi:hypothetical protein
VVTQKYSKFKLYLKRDNVEVGVMNEYSKLCPCALGFTVGVFKGLCLMLLALAGFFGGYGLPMVEHIAGIYPGYAPTILGGIFGGLYGFVGGYVFAMIFACVYNFFLNFRCKRGM